MTAPALQFAPYIAGLIAIIIGALGLVRHGEKKAEAKQAAAETKARDLADQVDNDLGTLTPAQKRQELERWGR